MFAITSTVVVMTLTFAQPAQPARGATEETQTKLIVKEKAYFLHALLPIPEARLPFKRWARGAPGTSDVEINGPVLLHTSLATGEMKVLAAAGTSIVPSIVEKNNPTSDIYKARIAGVAGDRERIYVLHWRSTPYEKPGLTLLIFRADTGEQIHAVKLKGKSVPEKEPEDNLKPGPLRLRADGVSCFGIRFELQGTERIKQSKEDRP